MVQVYNRFVFGKRIQVGYVDGQAYVGWIRGNRPNPPPTVYWTEPREESGRARQRRLGLEDRSPLLAVVHNTTAAHVNYSS